jgi:hypothetical protein
VGSIDAKSPRSKIAHYSPFKTHWLIISNPELLDKFNFKFISIFHLLTSEIILLTVKLAYDSEQLVCKP